MLLWQRAVSPMSVIPGGIHAVAAAQHVVGYHMGAAQWCAHKMPAHDSGTAYVTSPEMIVRRFIIYPCRIYSCLPMIFVVILSSFRKKRWRSFRCERKHPHICPDTRRSLRF